MTHYYVFTTLLGLALVCYLSEISPLMPTPKRMVQSFALIASIIVLLKDAHIL